MTHYCQCLYETASVFADGGAFKGAMLCAACGQPKRRALPNALMPIPEAAALLGLGVDNLRTLLAVETLKPTLRGQRHTLVNPVHLLAQLSQKGIRK